MQFELFTSVLGTELTAKSFLLCSITSIISGLILALTHIYKNRTTKSFAVTVALLPLIVQVIIMLVNGNLGTGIAVAGAFSLVRFRSVPGSAKEILSIFMAMAAGLSTGVGYVGVALIFTLLLALLTLFYNVINFGDTARLTREIKITVPESLTYTAAFDDLFEEYTLFNQLKRVKTTNMGSLYQLIYSVKLKDGSKEREFIDKLRCRNGNLEISFNYHPSITEEL